jgi:hypothetical protein
MARNILLVISLLMLGSLAQAQHKPKLPIQADKLCCGCTAIIDGTCVGYHCSLCPLVVTKAAENRVSLLPKELAPFLPELAPQCQKMLKKK